MINQRLFLYVWLLAILLTVGNLTASFLDRPYNQIDVKVLGNFHLDKKSGTIDDIPESIRRLDGQKLRLRGLMLNPSSSHPGTAYELVYNTVNSFGQPAQIQERILVRLPAGNPLC